MSANELINKAGTATATPTALAIASQMGSIPRGLHFFPDDGGDGGGDTGDDGAGDGGDDGIDDDSDDGSDDDGDDGDDGATVKKSQFDATLRDLRTERKQRKELDKRLKELEKGAPSPEELEELREFRVKRQQAEEDQKKKEGQFEKLIAEKDAKHTAELNRIQNELAEERQARQDERVDNVLAKSIPNHTTAPIDDVARLLRPFFKFDEEGEMVIEVNGEEPMNDKGEPMTANEFVAKFVSERPYLAALAPKGGSGGGTGRGRGSGKGGNRFTAEDLENMSYEDFKKNEKEIMKQAGAAGG